MENNGLRFYQIFNFGGAIGVNSLSFGQLIFANIATFLVMIVLLGVLATLIPIILFFVYGFLVLFGNWEGMQLDRIRVNIISIIAYVYFMIDYHFGFVGWSFFNTFFGSEFVDKFCYLNTGIFLFNIILLVIGNNIINQINFGLTRLVVFLGLSYIGYKTLVPIGSKISPAITTQYVPKPGEEIIKNDDEIVEEPYTGGTLEEEIEDFERGRSNYQSEPQTESEGMSLEEIEDIRRARSNENVTYPEDSLTNYKDCFH